MNAPSTLFDTHPRLGAAAFVAYWETDRTGEYPDQRFCEVLRHTYKRGACRRCGGLERRHVITDRLLVSPNKGTVTTHWWARCENGHGELSNYRNPWTEAAALTDEPPAAPEDPSHG